jgi:hypothetical protein
MGSLFSQTTEPVVGKSPKKIVKLDEALFIDYKATTLKHLFEVVATDTTKHTVTNWTTDFRPNYLSDPKFRYDTNNAQKTFFARLLEKLGNLLRKLFGLSDFENSGETFVLILKILSGLVILAALYFLIRLIIQNKGRWIFQRKNESIDIDINNTEQLIQMADFESLIAEMELKGDTRQCIRLYYLWLLKDLKDKKLIYWLPEKTNTDYLSELKNELVRKEFTYLSYLFNYIWYGEFKITDNDYTSAKNAFLSYLRKGMRNG